MNNIIQKGSMGIRQHFVDSNGMPVMIKGTLKIVTSNGQFDSMCEGLGVKIVNAIGKGTGLIAVDYEGNPESFDDLESLLLRKEALSRSLQIWQIEYHGIANFDHRTDFQNDTMNLLDTKIRTCREDIEEIDEQIRQAGQ